MAGGRRKKAPKTNKTKSKLDRSKTSKGEETQDITSSTTEVKSEKEKPIQNGCGKGQNQASESTSSPLESKYVPPFSRSSKNSSKNDEKSLGKSQIQTSQTLKRRLDESTDEISSENSSSSSCLKLKSKDDCTTSTNSTKKDNDDFIHLSKQPKMSANEGQEENIVKSIEEESTIECDDENHISSPKVIQTQDVGEDLKEMAIVDGFIQKVKLENHNGNHTCDNAISDSPRPSPTPKEKLCTDDEDSTPDSLSQIDELVKACVAFLVEKVEIVNKTGVPEALHTTTMSVSSTKDSIVPPKENNADSLMINNKTSDVQISQQSSQDTNNAVHKESLAHSPKSDAVDNFPDLQPKLVSTSSKELSTINEKQNTDKSTSRKGIEAEATGKDEQIVAPTKTGENSKDDTTTNKKASVNAGVDEDTDYEFLMDFTDSQLIEDGFLEEQSLSHGDGDKYSRAPATQLATGKQEKTSTTADFDTEDGSLLINELMREVSSLKNFLQTTWEKCEKLKKRH